MQDNKDMQQSEVIDLLDVWHSIVENIGFVRKVTLITTGLAVAYILIVPPTYESSALLRVKAQKGISTSILDAMPMNANIQLLKTYQEIIKSRSVVMPAVQKVLEPDDKGNYPRYEVVLDSITTMPFKDTEMISVAVKGKTPEQAQALNNALVESFLNRLTEVERTQYALTRVFIEDRLVEAKKELYNAEDNLIRFQKSHTVLNPDDAVKLIAEKFSMTDKMKAENQISMEVARSKVGDADNSMYSGAIGFADNDVIKAYNVEITRLETQKAELAAKYTEKHPAMVQLTQDIAQLKSKLDEAIRKVASVAQSNLDTLDKLQDQYGKDMAVLSDDQKEHVRLMRNVNVSQEIYTMLAKRLEEAKVAEVSISRDVQIVDSGDLPERPVAPKKARSLVLGFLLGLLGSCGWVTFMSLMNRTVKTAEDVENYLGLPVLGQIPSMQSMSKVEENAELTLAQKIWRTLWKK